LGPGAAPYAKDVIELIKKSDSTDVSYWAAAALALLGPAAAPYTRDIIELLKTDEVGYIGRGVAEALGQLRPTGAPYAADIAALLKSGAGYTGENAAEALGQLRPATGPYVKDIIELLKSDNAKVRSNAAEALGQLGSATTPYVENIIELLKSDESYIRSSAAKALSKLASIPVVYAQDIVQLLESDDADIRRSAVQAWGKLGPAATPYAKDIAQLLKSENGDVRSSAAEALGQLGPAAVSYAKNFIELLKSDNANFRGGAEVALGKLGAAAAPYTSDIIELLKSDYSDVRVAGVEALYGLGTAVTPYTKTVIELLKSEDPYVSSAAAKVIGDLDATAAPYADDIIELLKSDDSEVRSDAAKTLARLGTNILFEHSENLTHLLSNRSAETREVTSQLLRQGVKVPPSSTLMMLNSAHLQESERAERCLDAYLTATDPQQFLWVSWLGDRTESERRSLTSLEASERVKLLTGLNQACAKTKDEELRKIRQEIAVLVAALVEGTGREWAEVSLLEESYRVLRNTGCAAEATVVQGELDAIEWWRKAQKIMWIFLGHAAFWFGLVVLYPRSRTVQALFFWNKWVRCIAGCGYVHVVLILVPWLRRRLFLPFREALVQRGDVEEFNETAYFDGSEVRWGPRDHPQTSLVGKCFTGVKGQSLIEGQSGLGKTTLLRHLALDSQKTVVFIRATDCAEGVEEAIRRKLKGIASDSYFLRSLVHAGALDVLIDGINEASPDTRARISWFVEDYFKGNFMLTTQPMALADWEPPRTARIYRLLPLRAEQIVAFLNKQWPIVENISQISLEEFRGETARISVEHLVHETIADTLSPSINHPIGLANPMDATLAAELIARGQKPELERMLDQHFELARQTFAKNNPGRQFALSKFSERIYESVCAGKAEPNLEELEAERDCLVEHRLMLDRQTRRLQAERETMVRTWSFRHEKIRDYFLVPAFLDPDSDRPRKHVDREDVFGGVYELLATGLPETEALELQKFLVEDAADNRRNRLLNRYTLALRKRKVEVALLGLPASTPLPLLP
jgi:HEAT repeat protein